ncbi:YALIA101S03e10638g1_1 [Yarrowia lipolytica]|nr:YALIA101S03e10638g1_1 [Yarrowia lipolytica]
MCPIQLRPDKFRNQLRAQVVGLHTDGEQTQRKAAHCVLCVSATGFIEKITCMKNETRKIISIHQTRSLWARSRIGTYCSYKKYPDRRRSTALGCTALDCMGVGLACLLRPIVQEPDIKIDRNSYPRC